MTKTIELLPSDKRSKQLIKEHGCFWIELERKPCLCFDGDIGVFIESLDTKHTRWVRLASLRGK